MSKTTLPYCLKIWLTSVLLGPPLYYLMAHPQDSTALSFGEYLLFAVVGSLILSIPSFLLLWAGTSIIRSKGSQWPPLQQRIVIAVWASLLTAAPFLIIFGKDDPNTGSDSVRMCLSYLAPILAGIFAYRFGSKTDKDLPPV